MAGVRYFRQTLKRFSTFAKRRQLGDKAATLAMNKIEGLANKEYAATLKDFNEAEKTRIETEVAESTIGSVVVQKWTEARLAVIKLIEAELDLYLKLKKAGVGVRQDEAGNFIFFPDHGDFDWQGLENSLRPKEHPRADLDSGQAPPRRLPGS